MPPTEKPRTQPSLNYFAFLFGTFLVGAREPLCTTMRSPLFNFLVFILLPGLMAVLTVLISYYIFNSWWLELLSFFLPAILIAVHLILLLTVVLRPRWPYWIPTLLALVVAIKPMRETFAVNFEDKQRAADFTVMSFNAALFNPYRPYTLESDTGRYAEFYSHMRTNTSPDILCIQEFYHSLRSDGDMAVDSLLSLGGYSHFYTNPNFNDDYEGLIGVATFSKFPAVASGKLQFGSQRTYNGHWNDFLIHGDTIRVVNFQLQSMSIRWTSMDKNSMLRNIALNVRNYHNRLRWGYTMRNRELSIIEEFLQSSPHKVILCADINALPYSDTYQRLKKLYRNAFEEKGFGFGFTYHHFPWFIRIDNQFFDEDLGISHFRTREDISISDHFPIEAGYHLR